MKDKQYYIDTYGQRMFDVMFNKRKNLGEFKFKSYLEELEITSRKTSKHQLIITTHYMFESIFKCIIREDRLEKLLNKKV